jgi:hypothetical protein
MAPKNKKTKTSKQSATPPKALPSPSKPDEDAADISANWTNGYLDAVKANMETIFTKWPTIKTLDALPLTGDTGFQGLTGFGNPFDAEAYDTAKATSVDGAFSVSCHTNVFRHDVLESQLPYVPLYRERVVEFSESMLENPLTILQQSPLVLSADLQTGSSYNDANCQCDRLSACEPLHGLLHRVATRIEQNAQSQS